MTRPPVPVILSVIRPVLEPVGYNELNCIKIISEDITDSLILLAYNKMK